MNCELSKGAKYQQNEHFFNVWRVFCSFHPTVNLIIYIHWYLSLAMLTLLYIYSLENEYQTEIFL